MKIPEKVSLAVFESAIEEYEKSQCQRNGEERLSCKDCGSDIKYAICNISIHDLEWVECAGSGQVVIRRVPYCPECEDMKETFCACVHEKLFVRVEKQHHILLAIFTFMNKSVILSFLFGGAIGALITYLILHR